MTEKYFIGKGHGDLLGIVDPDNDFVKPNGALYVAGVDGESSNDLIIKLILLLVDMPFDHIVVTSDSHPEDHVEHKIFGPHCVMGTEGSEIIPELYRVISKMTELIYKGEDPNLIAYSVSTSPAWPKHIANLRKKGIKRIFLAGWAYTHCVGESAIAYATQGFEVFIIRNATRSVPPPYGNPEEMDAKLALYGVKNIHFSQLFKD